MQFELPFIRCKLLIDQNISFRLAAKLGALFAQVTHVKTAGFLDAQDFQIWNFARENDFIILTQDADFNDLTTLKGWPPKIIWLRCGNRNTPDLLDILRRSATAIQLFVEDEKSGLLEIYQ